MKLIAALVLALTLTACAMLDRGCFLYPDCARYNYGDNATRCDGD